jgi:hypothetical protein
LKKIYLVLISIFVSNAYALPIDWHGTFGVDTTRINDFRKGANPDTNPTAGSEVIPSTNGNRDNASFQSYVFRLNPNIVVNDSASLFGEITTGYGRGGFYGDNSINRQNTSANTPNRSFGNALYYYNTSNSDSNLVLNKFYMELYADTSTFVLGRQPINWGLGAVFNEGNGTWDRHTSVNDGASAKFKIGNFKFTPHWAKISSASGNKTDTANVTDYGVQALYDNPDKDLAMGVYYGKRKSRQNNTYLQSTATTALGDTSVKLIDIYFKKSWSRYTISGEIPMANGNLGHVYNSTSKVNYNSKAVIIDNKYEFNEKWTAGLNGGQISGADGSEGTFGAMYLNPNYQIANLLFRYNLFALSNSTQSVWDSYMTNAQYLKLYGKYQNESWVWNAALIYAEAMEVAHSGGFAFDHEKNQRFQANANQSKDLGYEIDFGFDYLWNPNVTVSGNAGYLMTGDYYKFTNTGATTPAKNMYVTSMSVALNF